MSMTSCALVDTGFYIDAEVAAYIQLASDKAGDTVPGEIKEVLENGAFAVRAKAGNLPCWYSDVSVTSEFLGDYGRHSSAFAGEVATLLPERTKSPMERSFRGTYLLYIPAPDAADLFLAPYSGPEELLADFKGIMKELSVVLPDDFDWWAHVVSINGTDFS